MKRLLLLCGVIIIVLASSCLSAVEYGHTSGTGPTGLVLGDIVNKYGPPCRVVWIRSTYGDLQLYFDYPELEAGTLRFDQEMLHALEPEATFWYLDPRMPVIFVDNYLGQNLCNTPGPMNDSEITSWRGFGTER